MNLRWYNPSNGRRYQAVLGQDLLGDSFLWRGWCGADGKRGGEKQDVFTWECDCLSAFRRVIRRREKRGYVLLDPAWPVVGYVQRKAAAAQKAPETEARVQRPVQPLA